jgi:glycosyltransferase involved in cell wall biosynthesis
MSKKSVAIIGPVYCNGGIASVINTVMKNDKLKDHYELLIFNTTKYKDGGLFINIIVFIKSLLFYLLELSKGKIDLAHIHTSYGRSFFRKIAFVFLSDFFNVKVILHLHTSKFDNIAVSDGLKGKLIKYSFKKSDALVVLFTASKDNIEKNFPVKDIIIINNPLPFNLDQISINSKIANIKNHVKILFMGFLLKSKGTDDLIEIADKLNGVPVPYKILVAGKGKEAKFIKKVKDKSLENIEFLGWTSGQEKLNLLQSSDVFLLPSYGEGMPIAILEAMSFGMPIVATKVGGIPELVIDGWNGFLLEPGDITGFVDKLKYLILDPVLRKEFGYRSRAMAKRFNGEKITGEWDKLYKKVLNGI